MRMLSELFPELIEKLDDNDDLNAEKRLIGKKTYPVLYFILSFKTHQKPCVLKHFKGALEAGTTVLKPIFSENN